MAAGTYLTRRWRTDMPVLALTGWQLLAGGLMLAPVALVADPPLPTLNLTQILAYAYLSIAGALFAYALWFRGIARLSPVAVLSLGLLSPLTAVILGWALLGQSVTGVSLVGLLMVLGSILAVQWASNRPTNHLHHFLKTVQSNLMESSMSNPIKQAIESRVSTNYYDPSRQLSDEDITVLVNQATRAPSAYNLQNWKFIAVRSPEAKARLKAVSYGQQKVADASVTFIICGTLAAHEQLGQALAMRQRGWGWPQGQ